MPNADLVLLHPPSVYDFRTRSTLYGPISDLVPSTPIFEMYPIGFTTIAEYLERHGFKVRIINLAVRMLQSSRFDVEKLIRSLKPLAFGIDLHWMPHCHGAIEIARIIKKCHPDIPVIFGGFSATYYHQELIERPEVDYVIRGDSTEEPVLLLMKHLRGDPDAPPLSEIPNLTWKESTAKSYVNPLTYSPPDLNHVLIDYSYVVRAVARYRDLVSFIPFKGWLGYPITAVLTCRGCTHSCRTCGGSAYAFRHIHKRTQPAYRAPELVAQDIRNIARFSKGPIFILGDIRQPGMDYAERFLEAIRGYEGPVIVELFDAADREFMLALGKALPNFVLEISPETHDDEVRRAFGRPYTTAQAEATFEYALEAGCKRLDVFFMIGLPKQDYESVMGTVEYCRRLLQEFDRDGDHRLIPFISPMAPFLDPGSEVFENPQKYGYKLFCRTLEEHRQALEQPSWKYILSYETVWMSRDEIVESTYEAGVRLNEAKLRCGLISRERAEDVSRRIRKARRLMRQIDEIMTISDQRRRHKLLRALKPQVDSANTSTVCDKRELNVPLGLFNIRLLQAAAIVARQTFQTILGGEAG
ncbi:MAG: TIGR04190 family B12-binding domain/radical SAM domain protein [Chloroflexi bacterium]|nr:MAG: TIGR04190 family B12-binding domain/radical SAM domain protein [Chloroflexota bacterium]